MFDRPGIKYTVEDASGNRAVTFRDLQEIGIAMNDNTGVSGVACTEHGLYVGLTACPGCNPEPAKPAQPDNPWQGFDGGLMKKDALAEDAKPQAPEWDGEGLPPVGCECEYDLSLNSWAPAQCIAIGHDRHEPHAVIQTTNRLYLVDDVARLRPLRTKEQRERDDFARAILDDLDAIDISISGNTATAMAVSLMNQGYRKIAKLGPEQQEEALAIVHRAWIEAGTGDEAADITNALLAKFDLLRKGG